MTTSLDAPPIAIEPDADVAQATPEFVLPPAKEKRLSGLAPVAASFRAGAQIGARATTRVVRAGWGLVAPYVEVVSGLGALVLLSGIVALVLGLLLGWPELTFMGIALLVAVLVALLFLIGRSTYSIDIELNPRRVIVGDRAIGRVLVTNIGKRPSTATTLEVPVGEGLAEFAIGGLQPGENTEELFAVPTNRRAVILAGPAVSVRGDQLGLFRRAVRWTDQIELFVHPITTRLHPTAAGLVRDLEGQITKKITNNDISFHALRAYVTGDDVRYVHWRTSARTGQLMVRQFEESRRSQLTIISSSDTRYFASDAELELAISVTASIGSQVIRDGTQISVVTENRVLKTHSVTSLLDDTCRIEPLTGSTATARDFAREATKRLPPPSVVVIIAGSLMDASDYRAIQRLFGGETNVMALRIEEGARARIQDVAGLAIVTIGALSDLPRVMARAV
ncbi:DUF58 domain-containing protein [Mycetocola zhadangensis]|uniref:DUF58 domain-containing protein n=1 Tax=Mycetocola zhadangensis TaxID=1164595 RepID=A0A3L7JA44_9MICO|nr:DUF58 domain-containing protein [Mycetocola zhadangensis]RLQ85382.1 DUF58 domain-containing protein [Mycetocola zhadangensis]GGE82098.1 hypothetical protein GCM10011313_00680 [Mycetocola zhadangensis]